MSALFLELDSTVISPPSPLAPNGEVGKSPTVVRLATKKLCVSIYAVVGLELLATTLADKHLAAVPTYCVLVRSLQILESLVTVITKVSPLSLMRFVYL